MNTYFLKENFSSYNLTWNCIEHCKIIPGPLLFFHHSWIPSSHRLFFKAPFYNNSILSTHFARESHCGYLAAIACQMFTRNKMQGIYREAEICRRETSPITCCIETRQAKRAIMVAERVCFPTGLGFIRITIWKVLALRDAPPSPFNNAHPSIYFASSLLDDVPETGLNPFQN